MSWLVHNKSSVMMDHCENDVILITINALANFENCVHSIICQVNLANNSKFIKQQLSWVNFPSLWPFDPHLQHKPVQGKFAFGTFSICFMGEWEWEWLMYFFCSLFNEWAILFLERQICNQLMHNSTTPKITNYPNS